jgi:hypothetical protein
VVHLPAHGGWLGGWAEAGWCGVGGAPVPAVTPALCMACSCPASVLPFCR